MGDEPKFLVPFIQKTYTPKNILQGLGEILEEKQKEWVKKELIQETIKEIKKLTEGAEGVR